MSTENLLNLDLDLGLDPKRKDVRKSLLKNCTKNKKLKNFINRVFRENKDIEICAWEDYGWEWDIECFDEDDCGSKVAICNHIFRDDGWEDGGWLMYDVPALFSNYFNDSFNWGDIRLDNNKYLLLIDEGDYLSFHIFDENKMEDGKADFLIYKNILQYVNLN